MKTRWIGFCVILAGVSLACSWSVPHPPAAAATPCPQVACAPCPPPATAAPTQAAPRLRITSPQPGEEISGGGFTMMGYGGPAFENTVVVYLCGEGGEGAPDAVCGTEDNILFSAPATIHAQDIGFPGPFDLNIPYSVSQRTNARLSVAIFSMRDGGLEDLVSTWVILQP